MLNKFDYNLRNYSDISNINDSFSTYANYGSKQSLNNSINPYHKNEDNK